MPRFLSATHAACIGSAFVFSVGVLPETTLFSCTVFSGSSDNQIPFDELFQMDVPAFFIRL
jgi:hypothetical protein